MREGPRAPPVSPFLDALPTYLRQWRAARKTVIPVAPTNARVPMRPRVSRADAPPARVRRASAKTHARSAKTVAAVDLARVGWDLVQPVIRSLD